MRYFFDQKTGLFLKGKQPLEIDHIDDIYDQNGQFLGNYNNIRQINIQKPEFMNEPTKDPYSRSKFTNKFIVNQTEKSINGY